MNPENVEELKKMIKNVVTLISDNQELLDEVWKVLAKNHKSYFLALKQEGFDDAQALILLTATLKTFRGNN